MDKVKTVKTDGKELSFNFVLKKHFCFVNGGENSLFM